MIEEMKPELMQPGSMDIAAEKNKLCKQMLMELLPEVVSENGIDFDQLKRALGEWVEPGKERFGLQWPGKVNCMRIINQPSMATLKPCREESVNFDETENLFIEGDNLAVLKLLQYSYFNKIKMIYIDPPYNTGKDFIYPDKFTDTLEAYLEYTGQVNGEGRRYSDNSDTDGRYHSNWLNMMYPRLYLAKNLLRDDGVIFISIDDNEQANLKLLCDHIFGEENFISNFIWKKRTGSNDSQNNTSIDHDYVVCYRKLQMALNGVTKDFTNYSNPDNDPRGAWAKDNLTCNKTSLERPNLYYPIVDPETGIIYKCNPNRVWVYEKQRMQKIISEGKVIFPKSPYGTPTYKRHKSEVLSDRKPFSSLIDTEMNFLATKKLRELLSGQFFDYPKGIDLIKQLVEQGTDTDDIILDFFAGSCTTAHAVMQLNAEDGGRRKFICVQLPEPCDENSEAYKAGYKNIADIGKERIRRAGKKIASEQAGSLDLNNSGSLDLGFKVFKLVQSNFKQWQGDMGKIDDLDKQLSLQIDHIDKASSAEYILYELLLKTGYPLTTKIERLTITGKEVFSIDEGALLICLEKEITQELMDAIVETCPDMYRIICLDEGFNGNDQLKVNAAQAFKVRNRSQDTQIKFETV